jgi:hypothetical protein
VNKDLLAVAARLLHEEGWAALRLERIAEAAGVSRATVWRHGLTRRAVEQLLREQLAADYQALMWEPLTMPGTGSERFAARCEHCAWSQSGTSRCWPTPTPHSTDPTWTQRGCASTTSPRFCGSSNKAKPTDHSPR